MLLRDTYPPTHPVWGFWTGWYQRALDGGAQDWDLLCQIALLDGEKENGKAFWDDPERVAEAIRRLQEDERTPLAKAYPVDFTFDSLLRVMRMVGIDDDTAHLRDPAVVQAFLDDCEELRDTLRNFNDFAFDLKGGGNFAGVLHRASKNVLDELQRTEDMTHLRARHLVRLCGQLEAFSKEEKARADLGETLSRMVDDSIALMQAVTRKHFGPSYTALAPLADLSLDHVDQDAVVELFDQMIARMEALPSNALVALDADGMAVFRDMLREVREFRATIAAATTEAFRAIMEDRFAESFGSTGLAFARFWETASGAAGHAGKEMDRAIKQYKRVKTASDIYDALQAFLDAGGTVS
ncbi:hypothetical protein RGUI_1896 [Rhodovulum sp. P5]|nr:hypothetical protein RGUI_1896 [Rhodovulum sp. P5]